MRFVVDKTGSAQIYVLAALSDHNDARMVSSPARWRGRSALVKAYSRNFSYPILFLAYSRSNLAGEFRPECRALLLDRMGVVSAVFHVGDLELWISKIAAP